MKNIILFIFCLFCFNSYATTSVDVVSAEFGVEDEAMNKTLCLTIVRVPKTTKLYGIVEVITDCYYARAAKKALTSRLKINLEVLKPIPAALGSHLQTFDTQLTYLYSEVE